MFSIESSSVGTEFKYVKSNEFFLRIKKCFFNWGEKEKPI